jgi:SOUL heme-binding protein
MRVTKLILPLALALFAASMPTHAIEEPAYEVTANIGDVELRQYAPYIVAEVLTTGSATEAGNKAFRILASYIFGKNKGEKKLAMTAPVTQTAAPMKLEMTAPVIQSAAPGGYLVQFVLPRGVTLDTAPEPIDQRIVLRQVQPMRVAVIRYSGFWSDANYNRHLTQLEETLRKAGVKWSGEPVYSRYNPPFTPWFLRRNEIWLQLPANAGNRPD